MASNEINVNICRDVMPRCRFNITISGLSEFKVRLWAAKWFFKAGAWIMGAGIEFESK